MDRLIATNSVTQANADVAPAAGTPQYATSGDPATNTPPTVLPAYQYNAMQEELVAVITGGGLATDKTKNNQVAQAIQRGLTYAADTGAVNAYACTLNPAPTAHVVGMEVRVKIANAPTGASTFTPNAGVLAPAPATRPDGSAIQSGDFPAGAIVGFTYDGAKYQVRPVLLPSTTQGMFWAREEQTSGSISADTFAANAWKKRTINTVKANTISSASLSGNQITLPAGTYLVAAESQAFNTDGARVRLYNATAAATIFEGGNASVQPGGSGNNVYVNPAIECVFTLAAPAVIELDIYANGTTSIDGGYPVSAGSAEVYSEIFITKVG